jgi:hypothetical protein
MGTRTVATGNGSEARGPARIHPLHEHVFRDVTRDVADRIGALGRRRNLKSN